MVSGYVLVLYALLYVSLDSQNGLLALLAYSGVGNSPLAVESETLPQKTSSNELKKKMEVGTC